MRLAATTVLAAALAFCAAAVAQPQQPVMNTVKNHKQPFLDTLRDLVNIESGSDDREGLDRIAELAASRLKALGGEVALVEAGADAYRMHDTPPKIGRMVHATFRGSGTKKILLIAHMDTVYRRGMLARQPYRVDAKKAYGLAISDDKQGVALVIHTIGVLKDLGFRDYGTLTVLFNGDEEISTPGARHMLSKLGAEHDVTISFEASRVASDKLSLATSGVGSALITVKGKASHSGSSPEKGINAMVELAHQILQLRDLSDPKTGLKMNWTNGKAGSGSHNVIPESADAHADVRVNVVSDFDRLEKEVNARLPNQLVKDAKVSFVLERRRPPLQLSPAAATVARHAQGIYKELGKDLVVDETAEGGGTDAAFAALSTKNAVVERFGVQGYGGHTADDEYILLASIEPRMYLAARMVMDISQGKVR